MKRLFLVSDAWHPQINGVVRTLERTITELVPLGVETTTLTPAEFRTIPCPTYPEIRLALTGFGAVRRKIEAAQPDFIHIATEGPLGLMTRAWCRRRGVRFTTSYHTRFPEYLAARLPVPLSVSYAFMRRFHNAASGVMVATASLEADLAGRGFRNLMRWSRGVDVTVFRPDRRPALDLPRPIFGYVGRVSVEKNIEAFLELDLPGTKVVIGDGPALEEMRRRFPEAVFTGTKVGEELADHYASLDVFVFPSLTDTFGNVLLEALASGVPVAAYPVMGPRDVVAADVGRLDRDLGRAALAALDVPRAACRAYAAGYSWRASTGQFLTNLRLAAGEARAPEALAAE
jgi:glycosyltransferase involved in cell wall biosynthesis